MSNSKPINKKITLLIFLLLFAVIIAVHVIFIDNDYFEGHYIKMDTEISVKGQGADMDLATRDILRTIDEIDNNMNANNVKGNLYRLNSKKEAPYNKDTAYVIELAEDVKKKSDGAFNIAIKPVIDVWGFGGNYPKVPSETELEKALKEMQLTEISANSSKLTLSNGKIDLGGIAKGFASDKAKNILDKYENIDYAILDFGGNILTYGQKPNGEKFKVAIDNGKNGVFATLNVGPCCVITSGGYERNFEENGKTYHHILDPKTGKPSDSGLVSVTIISDNGTLADALSTACFVLGLEKGSKLAESYGVEAVFLDENKNVYTVGNVDIELLDKGYSFK